MPVNREVRMFLRDLAMILGLPAIGLAGLLAWWRPWELIPWTTHPASEPVFEARLALERRARADGIHATRWRGLQLDFSEAWVLTVHEPVLEVLQRHPPADDTNDRWAGRMAFLETDSAALAQFHEAAANCDLAPGRCWRELAGGYELWCQRSAGVPDPEVPWTPHLECQVPALWMRVLINAPLPATDELLGEFREALAQREVAGSDD